MGKLQGVSSAWSTVYEFDSSDWEADSGDPNVPNTSNDRSKPEQLILNQRTLQSTTKQESMEYELIIF